MRLIDTSTLEIVELVVKDGLPPYAILSHTWGKPEEEVSFQDLAYNPEKAKQKVGYSKIEKSCELARKYGFRYIWIDTCCINKESSAELSEAINSMYQYYQDARVCYAYLADVDSKQDPRSEGSTFKKSRWFTRGWTLQELLAPETVVFFSSDWINIGTKASLRDVITSITGIPPSVLLPNHCTKSGLAKSKIDNYSIAQKMSWAAKRQTTRAEDLAYCLMGIFGVHMPPLYGEGGARAFMRLQEELIQYSDDQTIFAWRTPRTEVRQRWMTGPKLEYFGDDTIRGLFASSPAEFLESGNITQFPKSERVERYYRDMIPSTYAITNVGLQIGLPLLRVNNSSLTYFNRLTERKPVTGDIFLAVLDCRRQGRDVPLAVYLRRENGQQYVRVLPNRLALGQRGVWDLRKSIYVKLEGSSGADQDADFTPCKHTFKLSLPESVTILESHPKQVVDYDSDGVLDRDSQGRPVASISPREHGDFGVVKLQDKSRNMTFFVVFGCNSSKLHDHHGIWSDIIVDSEEETLHEIYTSYSNGDQRAAFRTYPVDRVVKALSNDEGVLMTVHKTPDLNKCIVEVGYVPASEVISRTKTRPSSSTYGFAIHVQSWVPNLRTKPLFFPRDMWSETRSSWLKRNIVSFNRTRDSGVIVFQGKDNSLLFAVALGIRQHKPWAEVITSFGSETVKTISKSYPKLLTQQVGSGQTGSSDVSAFVAQANFHVRVGIEENQELEEEITHWVDIRIDALQQARWASRFVSNTNVNASGLPVSHRQLHTWGVSHSAVKYQTPMPAQSQKPSVFPPVPAIRFMRPVGDTRNFGIAVRRILSIKRCKVC
ncbi:HET-domain-containing protein [Dendrothele bispora CBS 962.96]|uniref:HET-domain-containing protein n=1 Tax=Dendrothele bispora (strain CBS 962.96) TaxID=1314807 RepID=A0A4S8M671_DENBC|nr:HET-domain-containing protein [Dendrothele bispora CBS 962.96]